EPIGIQSLVVDVCDTKQMHTQYGGVRPFGVSLLVGGVDDLGPQLYTTDPSGSFWGWKAAAIGKESDVVRDFFKDKYQNGMNLESALKLALDGLLEARGDDGDVAPAEKAKTVEIGMIDTKEKLFRILSQKEVEERLTPSA
ncbi:MAG: archaeal proteasome endopeptidase complex subunit alpha, partial [Candidatus Thorarchaeota archaeon]